ncbi:saccharopine dehydrogenase NADP-binding domain-containing protein [Anaerovorax odorimutans]|nr:saccharopine dehydrogenase NADP-binding domain-containing protein [Anaerovorax odorimutans]
MKVLIVGAGGQGGPCASILSRDDTVEEIRLADLDLSVAQKVADKIGSPKIKIAAVDATKSSEVAKLADGVDVVMDFVMPWMAAYVMKGALTAKAHYVNSAFDTPFWEEIAEGKTREELTLCKDFEAAGLTSLLGCGMAPGFINVLIREQTDNMDRVDSIKIRLGKAKTGGGEYDDIIVPWNPGWAPIQALKDCADNAICFDQGKYGYVEPYAGIEEWPFEEPVGKKLVSHHSHEEPYSLPLTIGKGLKYCDFKYYVCYHPAALVSLGLASNEEIDVKGTKIKPIDVCAAVLPKAGNAFLTEDPAKFDYTDKHVFMSMQAEVQGEKDGKPVTSLINCPQMTTPCQPIYDLFGTTLVNVALPAVCGAKQIAEGAERGVIFAEQLDPQRYLEILKATGYPYEWQVTLK